MPLMILIRHPEYQLYALDWLKWRLTYRGGRPFIKRYLKKYSNREEQCDFDNRHEITYCPAFAKSAINEIKNAIFQRMIDITRIGGADSYQQAVITNIDRRGHNLNTFIGTEIIPELLTMRKVGIYVDMPKLNGPAIRDNQNKRPYIYSYKAEQILSWAYDEDNNLVNVLLEDCTDYIDPETNLPAGNVLRYRHIYFNSDGKVQIDFYDSDDKKIDETYTLNLTKLPIVILEINESLLVDVADYQIALLNLASSDVGYILKANFPFYVEQTDNRLTSDYLKKDEKTKTVEVGTGGGRTYPLGAERPDFIHPSPEPLKASMAKQDQLKEEIRLLVNLAVSGVQGGKIASAESKAFDERTLESGLSYIGLILEYAENEIGAIWSQYDPNEPPVIKYPESYSLKSDSDRSSEAAATAKQGGTVPSLTAKKFYAKKIVQLTLSNRLSYDQLQTIYKEIDNCKAIVFDQDAINADVENGILSLVTAAALKAYPASEPDAASADHAARLSRIAESQSTGIRGVDDSSDLNINDKKGKPTRGKNVRSTTENG